MDPLRPPPYDSPMWENKIMTKTWKDWFMRLQAFIASLTSGGGGGGGGHGGPASSGMWSYHNHAVAAAGTVNYQDAIITAVGIGYAAGVVTVNTSGWWAVSSGIIVDDSTGGSSVTFTSEVFINGAQNTPRVRGIFTLASTTAVGNASTIPLSHIFKLNATDTIEIRWSFTGGGSAPTLVANYGYFTGFLISFS